MEESYNQRREDSNDHGTGTVCISDHINESLTGLLQSLVSLEATLVQELNEHRIFDLVMCVKQGWKLYGQQINMEVNRVHRRSIILQCVALAWLMTQQPRQLKICLLYQVNSIRLKAAIQVLELAQNITGGSRKLGTDAAVVELAILHSQAFSLWMASPKAVSAALQLPEPVNLSISALNRNSSSEDATKLREQLISGAWLVIVQSLAALKECRRLDTFHFKAVYRVSNVIYYLARNDFFRQAPTFVHDALHALNIGVSQESAIVELSKLFDKKRPQIVAMWVVENSTSPWEQVQ